MRAHPAHPGEIVYKRRVGVAIECVPLSLKEGVDALGTLEGDAETMKKMIAFAFLASFVGVLAGCGEEKKPEPAKTEPAKTDEKK